MTVYRRQPKVEETEPVVHCRKPDDDNTWGFVMMPLAVVAAYFLTSAAVHVMFNSATSKLEQIVGVGALICFAVMSIVGVWRMVYDLSAAASERASNRKKWAEGCIVARVKIVGRSYDTWDDGYRFRSAGYLVLEMNSDQIALYPDQQTMNVRVSDTVYGRLEKSRTTRIYYKPETPLEFFLEDELIYA